MFANKSVLITGAAKGIGRATAQTFWSAGARVALLDCDKAALDDATRELDGNGPEVFLTHTDDEWHRILSVNLDGAFYAVRAAVPHLRTSQGSIVLVSSMTGIVGQPRGAAYDASKGAL